jgi:acetyl esterase/lipase
MQHGGLTKRIAITSALLFFLLCGVDGLFGDTSVTESNIVFGRGGDVDLELDLCRPDSGKGPFPALVFIAGTGWAPTPSSRKGAPIELAAAKGYVAIAIDHRSVSVTENGRTRYPFPAQLEDAKCAVRWLRANAPKYNIDADRIGVVGHSSGGHLALLLGLTSSRDGFEGTGGNPGWSSRVQAVVCMAGLAEAVSYYEDSIAAGQLVLLLGGTPDEVPKRYAAASPMTYVTREAAPVLFIQSEFDYYCPLKQTRLFEQRMKDAGASFTLIRKKGSSHYPEYGDPAVWKFLDERLKHGTS